MHKFCNDLERSAGTYLYGRRMYETMACWETDPSFPAESTTMRDYAEIWEAADKIVHSKTLQSVSTARTRIERAFDPEPVHQLKAAAGRDIVVGGPDLAVHAFRAELVDECHLFLAPIVGGRRQAMFGRPPVTRGRVQSPCDPRVGPGEGCLELAKHGVDFHEAGTVFDDPLATTFPDATHSVEERRYLTIGVSLGRRILVVAHTDRGEAVRVITARPATPRERRFYEQGDGRT